MTDITDLREAILELDKRVADIEAGLPDMGKAMTLAAKAIERLQADNLVLVKRVAALERRGKLRVVGIGEAAE